MSYSLWKISYYRKINFQDAEPLRTLKLAKESTRVGSSQTGTEEGLSDPSQKKARPWAAGGGGERETSLPSSASWSPLQFPSQAEEEVSGHTSPGAWPVLDPRRSRGWVPHKREREFQGPEADEGPCLQYPRPTQGGDSHHCGEGRGGEILPASLLAPKTCGGWTHRHLLLLSYLILWLPGWSQSECGRRQAERELSHRRSQPLLLPED